jgi:rubrerythrin
MDPITHRNVERAMRDEGYAFARYMLYGRRARAQGHRELADLFESLADVEAFDYFMHWAGLVGLASGSDVDNLREAMAAEMLDAADVYRTYEQQARDAGEDRAEAEFGRIRRDKERRERELARTLAKLETSTPHVHRILVVADEACDGPGLRDEVAYRAGRLPSEVLIVAPALTRSRLHYLASDVDHEAAEAADRMAALRDELEAVGVHARGIVGDPNPLTAIEDAVREFPADEIVVATHSAEDSTWLERGLVHTARERFAPRLVTHVVVDPALARGALVPGD